MTREKTSGLLLLWVSVLIFLPGCGTHNHKSFMRQDVNLAYIKTVALLPFESLGTNTGAAPRVREITMTQVLASGLFDVVDKGRVDSMLKTEAIDPGTPIDAPTLRRLGQRLDSQAFILGSVEQLADARTGGAVYPEISVTMRLIDAESGAVLWQASGQGSGYSLVDRLFGVSPKNSFQVTLDLVSKMLVTIR